MKIRILGCHGSEQLHEDVRLPPSKACGFLLNDTVMVDGGTISSQLTFSQQTKIRHVLLSHLHFDHIQGLPSLADNLAEDTAAHVEIASIPEVINGLKHHIFNEAVYPDFFKLPTPDHPILSSRYLESGQTFSINGLRVTAIRVNHSVPCVGFLIREGDVSIVYSGDTHDTHEIWDRAASEPTLKAAFIETSFPEEMSELAMTSKHLTPSLLARQIRRMNRRDLPIYVYHLKPKWHRTIERQLTELRIPNLTILTEGDELSLTVDSISQA
jgi:ribonuclease BN (tRNA processing enzyme)